MPRSPSARLSDILEAIGDIRAFTEGMDQTAFLEAPVRDRKTYWAVLAALLVIGEAVKGLPAQIRDRHPDISWHAIAGLRNLLAHEYFRVDADLVWAVLENGELDTLEACIRAEQHLSAGEGR
ncbi:HepT-like ribonuclease domain-containing protein [Roseibium litorale]|uniref:DUF86 domain-containing protein n=1 Tax=Roseibium litorale TaxID=2803841 RepID=A0ABR9CTS2_9HYPH|nr:DUF86 domain-containing protein [Roseibium litorale]MBD8894263.1 DUF86 domain-containing protein [Roseibium litorale]